MHEKGHNNVMEQLQELLTKLQTAQNREKVLRGNAATIASQLEGVAKSLRQNPAGVVLGEDVPTKVASIATELRALRTEIDALAYDLKEIHGLSDIANTLLKG